MQTLDSPPNIAIALASDEDRPAIYRLRHEVYAVELAQHPVNGAGQLVDALDVCNAYITVAIRGAVVGCISITAPDAASFSIEKYIARTDLPIELDDRTFEIRLLTVAPGHRGGALAVLLMYAAMRWVQERGGTQIIAMGRNEVMPLYCKVGLRRTGRIIRSGELEFEIMHASITDLRSGLRRIDRVLRKLEPAMDWRLDMPFRRPSTCYHGGAFFHGIGEDLQSLHRRRSIINADVLDAWFPPSPKAIQAMRGHFSWLMRTSPPTNCEGLIRTIAEVRGVKAGHILPGAGSSDLIFRTLREWLNPSSRVLILDPMYGEYAHVLEHVIGCHVERFALSRADAYRVDTGRLLKTVRAGRFDLLILVNPNSPTGRHISRDALKAMLMRVPPKCRAWIDETYIEYAGAAQSLEQFASQRDNIVICKSMSKVYALSGMRAAYLCGSEGLLEPLRAITPPWVIGLPTQLAAISALRDPEYYRQRYRQTHALRERLADQIASIGGIDVTPGIANFILCHLPPSGPDAATAVERCREAGLFLRDASALGGAVLGRFALRIAVKDEKTNRRMIEILRNVL